MRRTPERMAKVRPPTVAGQFYDGDAEALQAQIENCFRHEFGPGQLPKVNKNGLRKIVGLICPHAGYVYSGSVASKAYYELALDGKPDTIVILGPNHTGYGSGLAIMNEGFWHTPMGDVEIDTQIANRIIEETEIVDVNESAHRFEHSIEVQLPFLQYIYGRTFKFVPISFLMQDLQSATEIGKALAEILANKNALVIASSDFTHYEPQQSVNRKDASVLKAIEALDEKLFYSVIEKENVSACGYGPIAALITFSKALGVKKAVVLSHKTSGDITGDFSSVVGYSSVMLKKGDEET
jgi:AmmeMemoRadiSam system protein B